jgi:hypothetical protein
MHSKRLVFRDRRRPAVMPRVLPYPSVEDLEAFALGQFDDEAFAEVAEHVGTCPQCQAATGIKPAAR